MFVLGATSNECSVCIGKRIRLNRDNNGTTVISNKNQVQSTPKGNILPALDNAWPLLDQLPVDNKFLLQQQMVNSACSEPRQRRCEPRYYSFISTTRPYGLRQATCKYGKSASTGLPNKTVEYFNGQLANNIDNMYNDNNICTFP